MSTVFGSTAAGVIILILIVLVIALLGLEWAMLRSAMPAREVVQQFIFALIFGSVVDLTMFLLFFLNPEAYWQRLVTVGASCFVMAFGVYLTLICRVGVMAGDGFARALAGKIGKSFATTRIISPRLLWSHDTRSTVPSDIRRA